MNLFASLSTFAVVGYAQTATFTSKDVFGNILDQQTVEGLAGESFKATIDLGVAPKNIDQIELGVSTYGIGACNFYMDKKCSHEEANTYIGTFENMCSWPNISTEGNNFTGYLNVRNLNQFKHKALLTIECPILDVTLKKQPVETCAVNRPNTVANNQLKEKVFSFEDVFRSKKAYMKEATFIYLTQFGKIFLGGANPAVDFWLDLHNLITFKKQFKAAFAADGFKTYKKLYGSKGDSSQSMQGQYVNEVDRFLYKGAKIYGFTTFGVQTIADLFVMVATYKYSTATSAEEKLDAVNETVFAWNKDNWHFYQMIQGNKEYDSDFYNELQFWYYVQAAFLETSGLIQMIRFDKYYIAATWPRLAKSYWELVALGFMNTSD